MQAGGVELAYASTVYGAQGQTVDTAHVVIGDHTNAAGAYVAMTRGRRHNTAHLVAESVTDAREQWAAVFARDGADLGPTHAAQMAGQAIDRYGPTPGRRAVSRGQLSDRSAMHPPYNSPASASGPALGR